jgi:hypothetical protein
MHCQQWIEQMREPDAMGFGDQPEQLAITIERPWPSLLNEGKMRFVAAEEESVGNSPIGFTVYQGDGIGAMPLNAHHRDGDIGQNPTEKGIRLNIF